MAKRKEEKKVMDEVQPDIQPEAQPCENGCEAPPTEENRSTCEETLMNELEAAKAKCDEYLTMAQRTQADFDNFRRRNASAKQDARIDGICEAAEAIIPVLDNLERAVMTVEEGPVKTGLDMIIKQFTAALNSIQVEEIEAEGKSFDPAVHNAVMQEPAADPELADTVAMVLQKGYRRGDRIIRCSMVKVYQ